MALIRIGRHDIDANMYRFAALQAHKVLQRQNRSYCKEKSSVICLFGLSTNVF